MLNKNFKVSKQYFQYVKRGSGTRFLKSDSLEKPYQDILDNEILPNFPNKEQIDVFAYSQCNDIEIIVKLPILLLEKGTYYLTEAWFKYLIDKDKGIVYSSCSALRMSGLSLKPYAKSTLMRFHKYYNEWLDQQKIS